ncbi:hypothetical protein OH76DRAFT_1095141 [Lentinus brumalis]|uniref:Uncharacterized protein n=1 Tax=Lentinus brumalis TaxID=2498619 RepID=A0A371CW56_9APHY|nr:hypothetical protein OH76DRAFT_1095141 [Polyporus brumalis]
MNRTCTVPVSVPSRLRAQVSQSQRLRARHVHIDTCAATARAGRWMHLKFQQDPGDLRPQGSTSDAVRVTVDTYKYTHTHTHTHLKDCRLPRNRQQTSIVTREVPSGDPQPGRALPPLPRLTVLQGFMSVAYACSSLSSHLSSESESESRTNPRAHT